MPDTIPSLYDEVYEEWYEVHGVGIRRSSSLQQPLTLKKVVLTSEDGHLSWEAASPDKRFSIPERFSSVKDAREAGRATTGPYWWERITSFDVVKKSRFVSEVSTVVETNFE